jgi:hypothetical protein
MPEWFKKNDSSSVILAYWVCISNIAEYKKRGNVNKNGEILLCEETSLEDSKD